MKRLFAFVPIMLAGACQTPTPVMQTPSPEATAQIPAAAASVANFGAKPTDENLVWSPVSAYVALAMLTEGASGDTEAKLAKALELKSPDALSALLSSMAGDEVTIADAVFVRKDLQAAPAFSDRVARLYAAEALPLLGVDQVNGWVAAKTKDRIPKLFDGFDPSIATVLVNAVTFDGKWAKPFDPADTKPLPFQAPGGAKSVPMMAANREMLYGENDGAKMISMPYEGGKYEMVVWLPKQGEKPDPYQDLKAWRGVSRRRKVDLLLPRWEMRSRHDLQPLLAGIGLSSLFEKGDFRRLVPSGELDHIGKAVQEAWIQVDESGTKAAAATGIAMATSSFNSNGPAEFHADRPFAYAIIHTPTGTPLFLGTVANPKG